LLIVSGGTLCPDMFRSIASTKAPVPYICMHMRGDPSTMQSAENTAYAFGDVPLVVGRELSARVAATTESGVEPWRIWLDPGIGFAKSHNGNWDLLGNLDRVRETLKTNGSGCVANAPMLVGVSRKGFLGAATGHKNATDRDRATAAACAVAIAGGADIVRVHDVQAVVDAVKVADQVRLARARTKHTRE
jgi:2-amino-4-hydroxy-6-hydroxymethyldihydropteridine diphosphokinase/dihydropteroate synthase